MTEKKMSDYAADRRRLVADRPMGMTFIGNVGSGGGGGGSSAPQVTAAEKAAGTETAVRGFSPADAVDMVGLWESPTPVSSVNGQTGSVSLDASDLVLSAAINGTGLTTASTLQVATAAFGAAVGAVAANMPSSGTYQAGQIVNLTTPVNIDGLTGTGWSRLTTGSAHVLNTDWRELWVPSIDYRKASFLYDDFDCGSASVPGRLPWAIIGATNASWTAIEGVTNGNQKIGVFGVGSNTTNGTTYGMYLRSTTLFSAFNFWELSVITGQTSNCILRVGIADNPTADLSAQEGAYFDFVPGTDSHWVCCTRSNTAQTSTTTTVAPATNVWNTLRINHNANGDYQFYIDGVSVATHVSGVDNLPRNTKRCGAGLQIQCTNSAQQNMYLDWYKTLFVVAAARS